jgi:hypothetical protein
MTKKLIGRRKDVRLRTELPVSLEKATGITRDMSASGAFFWTSGNHAVGDKISFAIGLKGGSGMVWSCEGEVVRVEPRGKDVGVAVKIIRSTVEPPKGRVNQVNGRE